MPATAKGERKIITDKLVVDKTGKTMAEWFEVIDEKGGRDLDARGIYALVAGIEGLKPLGEWNQNLLSTSYQWDRGLRGRGEKAGGYEVSGSKTIGVPIAMLYAAFTDDDLRGRWLDDQITITKSTENKSARAVWSDGATRLSVDFYPKGDAKSQIVVQHLKIPTHETSVELKVFWGETLDRLKTLLEAS